MIAVNPSAPFEAVAQFDTGLTGTLGVRIRDNEGNDATPRSTAGIAEDIAGSGIYVVTLTAPATAGQYTVVWDDGATPTPSYAIDDLFVTGDTAGPIVGLAGSLYVTVADLKKILEMQNESFADEALGIAVPAASRAIDGYQGTHYYPIAAVKYFTPDRYEPRLGIGDWITMSSVRIDTDGDGTFETLLSEGTDWLAEPYNAVFAGHPYKAVTLRTPASAAGRWPRYEHSVKVTAVYGWAETPYQVREAAVLLANRFLTRMKDAPLGILVAAANDMVATARLGRIDPDVAFLLDQIPGSPPAMSSIQLR